MAWSRDCKARIEQYQKAKEAYLTRPKSFQVHQKAATGTLPQEDGFTLVGSTQKRRKIIGHSQKSTLLAPKPIGRPSFSRLNENSATGTPTLAQFHFTPSQSVEVDMREDRSEAGSQSTTPTLSNE